MPVVALRARLLRPRSLARLCLGAVICLPPRPANAGDDFVIEIDESDAAPAAAPLSSTPPSPTGDLIIIDEDEDAPAGVPPPSPEPRLFPLRADFVAVSGRLLGRGGLGYLQGARSDPWRGLAEGTFSIDLQPENPWRAHLDAVVRGTGLAAWPAPRDLPRALPALTPDAYRSSASAELGEAWVSLRVPKGSLTLGRQSLALSRNELARFADVLNPADNRAGLLFPEGDAGRLPVLALAGRILLGRIALQAAWVPLFEPPRSHFFASQAQAVQPLQPPLALAPSPTALGLPDLGRGYGLTNQAIVGPRTGVESTELLLRATGTAGGVDLGVQLFAGYDRTPTLSLPAGMAIALGRAGDGLAPADGARGLQRLCPTPGQSGGCTPMRELVQFDYRRTVVGQIDASTMVGVTVLKAELMASPAWSPLPGATVLLVDTASHALQSASYTKLAAAVTLETGYGEWLQGSIDLVDVAFLNVPGGVRLARLEPAELDASGERTVHRFAIATALRGSLFDNDVAWRLAALVSPLQRDYAVAPRLAYRAAYGQELAAGAEIVGGPAGTFGGFFASASRVYLEWNLSF